MKKQIGVSEYSRMTGLARQTIYNRIAAGKLESVQVDGVTKVIIDDIDMIDNAAQMDGHRPTVDGDSVNMDGERAAFDGPNEVKSNVYVKKKKSVDLDKIDSELYNELHQRDQDLIDELRSEIEGLKADKDHLKELLRHEQEQLSRAQDDGDQLRHQLRAAQAQLAIAAESAPVVPADDAAAPDPADQIGMEPEKATEPEKAESGLWARFKSWFLS